MDVYILKNLESKSKVYKKYRHNRNLENLCSFSAILFIFFVIYFFSDLLCCRVPLVLLRFAVFGKSVFVTFIRKGQKMDKNGELENLDFYEFRADTRTFSQGH